MEVGLMSSEINSLIATDVSASRTLTLCSVRRVRNSSLNIPQCLLVSSRCLSRRPPNPSAQVLLKFFQSFNALDLPSLFSCFSDESFAFKILQEESMKSMGRMTVLDKSALEQEVRKVVEILKAPEVC